MKAISDRNDSRPMWDSGLGGTLGGGLEEEERGERDEEEKIHGTEKTRTKGKNRRNTQPKARKKLKEMFEKHGICFEAVQGFKQNSMVHQQLRPQTAGIQPLQPITDASIARTLAEEFVFFAVFDRHSKAIADWEFPIAVQ